MSDQRGKVVSFGRFELSIGNRLLTNGAKVVPLGARAPWISSSSWWSKQTRSSVGEP
jgi:hypothetical protein